jgi:hypothetical protein
MPNMRLEMNAIPPTLTISNPVGGPVYIPLMLTDFRPKDETVEEVEGTLSVVQDW